MLGRRTSQSPRHLMIPCGPVVVQAASQIHPCMNRKSHLETTADAKDYHTTAVICGVITDMHRYVSWSADQYGAR